MKKILLLSIVFFLPFLIIAQSHTIQGIVTEKDSGKALPQARITIGDLDLYVPISKDGSFSLGQIKPGKYRIKASHIGYKSIEQNINLNSDTKLVFELDKEIIMTEEVIISASRLQENAPGTYTNINEKEISQFNTGQDLPYLIKMTPSVVTTSDAGTGVGYTGMRIRGSDLTRINVTLNGIPVNDPESHNVFFVDMPDLASSVNDIQIQRGIGTSTNGSAAFGASINIQTNQLKDKAYAETNSAYGSFNTLKNSLLFGTGKLKNNWSFDGRFSVISSDGYIDRASSGLKSAYFSGGYFGKKTIVKGLVMMGKEITYQAWNGISKEKLESDRTYNPSGEMYNEDEFVGFYDNQVDNYQQNYFQLHFAHEIKQSLHFTASAFYTKGFGFYESYKNNRSFSDYNINNVIIGNDTITSTNLIQQKWLDNDFYGVNTSIHYTQNKFDLKIGGGWNQYAGDHFGMIIWSELASNNFIDEPWYENTGTKSDYHTFAKLNYQVSKRISFLTDIQYRNINYQISGIHDDLRDISQVHDFSFINPKEGVYFDINDKHHLYATFGLSHREPNRTVYREADENQIDSILPERLFGYELGHKLFHKKGVLITNIYFMDYKNQLVLTGEINDVGAYIMTNVPVSYRVGVELSSEYSFNDLLQWYFTATYSYNKIKEYKTYVDDWDNWGSQLEDEYDLTDISFSPNVTAANKIIISPFTNFRVMLNSTFVSKQYIDNTENEARSLDPYHVHDLKFIYGWDMKSFEKIELSLSINNLLDHQYESNAWVYRFYSEGAENMYSGYFPQAGLNFMAGLKLNF